MNRPLKLASVFVSAWMLGLFLGATSPVTPAHAEGISSVAASAAVPVSEMAPPPNDPNKKKAGEECKDKSECQKHHSCEKDGDKKVCKAPPRPTLPPGAVT